MELKKLAESLQFFSATKPIEDIEVTGLEMDSRQVKEGDLFVCIKGFTVDGHEYAKQAEIQGAVAIVSEKNLDVSVPVIIVQDTARGLALLSNKFYDYPTKKLQVVGVTGTNGKTSVTYLMEAIFKEENRNTGLIGTIQMKIGNERFDVKNTTPDSLFLQKSFNEMVNKGTDTAVMEVSSHALDMGRVFGCDFDIAIFTNLTQDHLDYHADMKDYLRAKSMLFAQLGNKYNEDNPKFAVLNADDPYFDDLAKSTAQPVLSYGITNKAEVYASEIELDSNGVSFYLHAFEDKIKINSKLMGIFSVYNMLASAAAGICAGVSLKAIQQAFERTTGVSGRFEPVNRGQHFGVIVDYAHTPDSLENVLQTIRSFVKGRVITVVGCGGDRDRLKRPLMTKAALEYSNWVIVTADNPRTEDPMAIAADMVRDASGDHYEVKIDRKAAIYKAIEQAEKNDIVLIAGKGHETYQIIGEEKMDFDDRKVAGEAIAAKINKEK